MTSQINTPQTQPFQGRKLLLARAVWAAVVILTVTVIVAAIPLRFHDYFARGITQGGGGALIGPITIDYAAYGLTPTFFGWYFILIDLLQITGFVAIGLVIYRYQSNRAAGIFMSIAFITAGVFITAIINPLTRGLLNPWFIPATLVWMIGSVCVFLFFFVFPDGRFVPAWGRWLILPYMVWELVRITIDDVYEFYNLTLPSFFAYNYDYPVFLGFLGVGLFAQIYRFRYIATPLQRQQSKWVVLGLSGQLAFSLLAYLLPRWFVELFKMNELWFVILALGVQPVIYNVFVFLLLLAFAFAVLQYRLWDVDFIINQSLVYGSLTVLLAAVFFGCIFILQNVFQLLLGSEQTNLAAIFATLAITVAFQPARRQLRRFVDQRFYNIQIDYNKTPHPIPAPTATGLTSVLRQTGFGEYKNLELIGRGGMAEVYKSTHPALGKPVAIKILPAHLATEANFRQRFTREAHVVAQLKHPNIVRIFDSGEQDGLHYMVMEYLIGKDLGEYIKTKGKLSLTQTLPLVHQIAAALDYAHTQGLVHRDIKPSNVLLDTAAHVEVRAVLTDFGIAKIMSAHTAITHTGGMLGTLDYMAPEQIQASANVDGKADIYALGVMIYQMLTGELPFKHNNPGALLIAHLTQPPPNPGEIVPNLPGHVVSAIQRAMMKKPEERFATATEFAADLSGNEN